MINVYCKEKIILNWVSNVQKELAGMYTFILHENLNSLKNELDIKKNMSNVLIDIEDINYSLFTKSYFKENNKVKFIGIGYKKGVEEIVQLIDNNIFSFISIDNNSLEVVKALNNLNKGKYYFCDETKDQLIENYIKTIKSEKYKIKIELIQSDIEKSFTLPKIIKPLSEKERKVSDLLAQGLSYKEIAKVMGVTTFAINQNAKSIFKKLNVRSRAELGYRMFS